MASLAWIPDLGWYALVMIDENQIVRFSQFVPIFIVMMISLLLLLFYIIRITDRIVLDPLKKLVRVMERVRQGEVHVHAAGTGEYEVARVAEEFDHMISELARQQRRIIEQERLAQGEVVRKCSPPSPHPVSAGLFSLPSCSQPRRSAEIIRLLPQQGSPGTGSECLGTRDHPGVIMLMTQSAVNTILLMHPDSPGIFRFCQPGLYENIHARLREISMTCYFLTSARTVNSALRGHTQRYSFSCGGRECGHQANGTWLGVS